MGFYFDNSGQRAHRHRDEDVEREDEDRAPRRPSPGKHSHTHGGGNALGVPGKGSLTVRLAQCIERSTRAGHEAHALVQRKSASPMSEQDVSHALHASDGQPLPDEVRAHMEAALGMDFSAVRIHEGPLARSLGALAFTRGTDIFFAPGQYDPGSERGLELLGHELAHVMQQARGRVRGAAHAQGVTIDDDASLEREADTLGARAARGQQDRQKTTLSRAPVIGAAPAQAGAPAAIQARRSDFQIRGEHEPEEGELPNYVFFDHGSTTLSAEQRERLLQIISRLSDEDRTRIRLRGMASEEGDREANQRAAEARIDAVAAVLEAEGIPASAITRDPQPIASRGQIQYRRWRAVEVVAGDSSGGLSCADGPTTGQFSTDQRALFDQALQQGLDWVREARKALVEHDPSAGQALPPQVVEFFGQQADLQRLIDDLETLHTSMDVRTRAAVLGTPCDTGCAAGHLAYHRNDQITVCPGLFDEDPLQIARILVHESAHLDSGLDTIDLAYGHSRLGRRLPTQDAYRNADSYALMVTALNGLTGLPGSTPVEDELSALPTEADREAARDALAYVERWVGEGALIANFIYDKVNEGLDATPVAWPSNLARDLMLDVGREFRVEARPDRPLEDNRGVLAAIHDRYTAMENLFDTPIRVTPATGDTTTWTGDHVEAAPALWNMPLPSRVPALLRSLVASRSDISPEMVEAYVNITQIFSRVRGINP